MPLDDIIRVPEQEVLGPNEATIPVRCLPNPVTLEDYRIEAPEGLNLVEILALAIPDQSLHPLCHIYLEDDEIPRHVWHRVRPKRGKKVAIRVVPHGGDNKILRAILVLAVIIAAIVLAPLIGPALGITTATGLQVLTAVIGFVGLLIVNALVPPPKPKLPDLTGEDNVSRSLVGGRNRINPFGVIPRPLGDNREVPPLGANSFTELVGNDQFLRQLFVWGYGPLEISELKIGDTLLENFTDVEIETRDGFGSNPQTFLPANVSRNLLLWSEEFDNVVWTDPIGEWTVVANSEVAPDGTRTADVLTVNAIDNSSLVRQLLSADPNTPISGSVWAKVISGVITDFRMDFGDSTGQALVSQLIADEWVRLQAPNLANTTANNWLDFQIDFTGASAEIALWGAQLEQSVTVGGYAKTEAAEASAINISEHCIIDGQVLQVTTDGILPLGLVNNPQTFVNNDVNFFLNTITITAHGYTDDQPLEFTEGLEDLDVLPLGITEGTRYFVINSTANDFQISKSIQGSVLDIQDAGVGTHTITAGYFSVETTATGFQLSLSPEGTPIDLTDGGTGTHTITRHIEPITLYTNDVEQEDFNLQIKQVDGWSVRTIAQEADEITLDVTFPQGLVKFDNDGKRRFFQVSLEIQFAAISSNNAQDFVPGDVNTTTDVITSTAHGFTNGQAVLFTTTVTLPDPLTPGTDFFILNATANDYQVEATIGGGAVDLIDGGTGTHTATFRDWNANNKSFPLRTVGPFPDPGVKTVRERDGPTTTINKQRKDRVVMNRFTGDLSIIQGQAVARESIGDRGTQRLASANPPIIPSDAQPIAQIVRLHDDGDVVNSNIIDERALRGTPPFGIPATDFLPSETTPTSISIDIAAGSLSVFTLDVKAAEPSVIRRGVRFVTPFRAVYDVRVRRTSNDETTTQILDDSFWTALRAIRYENPVNFDGLALTALRIKATDQLFGVVDEFSGLVQSILLDWNGTDWQLQQTNNPASIFREILQGKANARRLNTSRIDLFSLQDWHQKNVSDGFTFNQVVDFNVTVDDLLRTVASAGRAAPTIANTGKWGIIIDEVKTSIIQHFTPRNSKEFSGSKVFIESPEALRVRFINEEKGYTQDERIVPDDGFTELTAKKLEEIELPGITDPELIWRHARFHLAQSRLRPEVYNFSTDFEHIRCTRGDLIKVAHDVPAFGLDWGRVVEVRITGGNVVGVVVDEPILIESGKTYSMRFRRDDDVSILAPLVPNIGEDTFVSFITPILPQDGPVEGNLFLFGETGTESINLVVKSILPGTDLTARITCVDAANNIHSADSLDLTFGPSAINTTEENITIPDNDLRNDDLVTFKTDDLIPGGLAVTPQTFGPGAVDEVTDRILMEDHNYGNFQLLRFTTSDTLPGGLVRTTTYYARDVGPNEFKVSLTPNGPAVDITDGGLGTHTITSGYWIIDLSGDVFRVSFLKGGGLVSLSSGGTGTHTLRKLIPPFDSQVSTPIGLGVPVVESIRSGGAELLRGADGSFITRALVTFDPTVALQTEVSSVEAEFRKVDFTTGDTSDAPFLPAGIQLAESRQFSITDVEDGETYDFRFRFITSESDRGSWSLDTQHTIEGKTAPPADVANFTAVALKFGVVLNWDEVPDVDISHYQVRTGGTSWETATSSKRARGNTITLDVLLTGTTDFRIKAFDLFGNESVNATLFQFTVIPPGALSIAGNFNGADFVLTWSVTEGTYPISEFDVHRGGTIFGTDTTPVTILDTGIYTAKADWVGSEKWWVRARDVAGNNGVAQNIDVVISLPIVSDFRSTVIDNNVLLFWNTASGTLPVTTYEIRKGSVFSTSQLVGTSDTTFSNIFEKGGGIFTYWITALDSAGNISTEVSHSATVDEPADFVFRNQFRSDKIGVSTNIRRQTYFTERGLFFPGNENLHYIDLDNAIMNGLTDFTFEVRFQAEVSSTNTLLVYLSAARAADADEVVSYLNLDANGAAFAVTIKIRATALQWNSTDGVPILSDGLNHTISFTRVSSTGSVELFIDGVSKGSKILGTGVLVVDAFGLIIGQDQTAVGVRAGGTVSFQGVISEVRFWNDIRTSVEIAANDDIEFDPTNDSSLVGLFRLNEGIDTIANDLSDSDRDGNIFPSLTPNWNIPKATAILPANLTETWDNHFVNNSWTTIQAQITAGFPIYIQPTPAAAELVEFFDMGAVLTSSRVVLDVNSELIAGAALTVTPIIQAKKLVTDSYVTINSAGAFEGFANDFRYLRIEIDWTGGSTASVLRLDQIDVVSRVKLKQDSGTVSVTGVGGATVTFNTSFIDIESIVATPQATDARFAVVDFTDTPNPTQFTVFVFDDAGVFPGTTTVRWSARGF